mgnify:CR=1 FL=1
MNVEVRDKINQFKHQLGRVFDTDLTTVQWVNYVDYLIIGLISLSSLSIFISTFDISSSLRSVLHVVDVVTLVAFTIEVTLRIWAADELSPRYRGVVGRLRYCLTFYGLIDVLSTYTFYLTLFLPLPYVVLKSLRVLRLLRILRYMRSFRLLQEAVVSKAQEIRVSLQFLLIVTLMLSFLLYFTEYKVQPEVFGDGAKSIMWAFAQYVGDPGKFADTPPVTASGQVIAFIIGILGIAIFAIPAGLVGAGFSEVFDEHRRRDETKKNTELLGATFERRLDRPTGFRVVPQYLSVCDIQARVGLSMPEVLDVVNSSPSFRLANLATTQTVDEHPTDRLVIEHFLVNTRYGCFIDRGSRVTIVSPSSLVDAGTGSFSYYVALIGGFNYISRERGELRPYKSYYSFADRDSEPNLRKYMEDLERLTSREGSWTLTMLAASGANEPSYPTALHFSIGGAKGDESCEGDNLIVKDVAAYRSFYEDLSRVIERDFGLKSDHQRYHNLTTQKLFARQYTPGRGAENNIVLRVAWSAFLWDPRRVAIAKSIADALRRHFDKGRVEYDPDLKVKKSGY